MSRTAQQTTVARVVTETGVGLHSGERTAVRLLPAEADAGIVFVSDSGVEIPATVEHVVSTDRCTTLGIGDARVSTVEHILGTLYAMGIDNVRVAMEGPEVPACDGSALEWVSRVREAGRRRLEKARHVRAVARVVWVGEEDWWAMALPARGLSVAVAVEFAGTVVGRQAVWAALTERSFVSELAPARTFAFTHELEALRAAGLARGGSGENAFTVGPEGYSGPLRFEDEVVRHKALDLVGDLALCGHRFRGQVVAVRPSHRANVVLARALRSVLGSEAASGVAHAETRSQPGACSGAPE